MYEEKIIRNEYIKLLALNITHLETIVVMEKNTNVQAEIDEFKRTYGSNKSIVIFIIHMTYNDDIKFTDYQRICDNIHPFDYVKDLITKKNGYILHRNDVTNDELYDQARVTYIQEK